MPTLLNPIEYLKPEQVETESWTFSILIDSENESRPLLQSEATPIRNVLHSIPVPLLG